MIFQSFTYCFVGADILGDWQGGGYDWYTKEEFQNGKMSRHFQLEANMTLSGAAADRRLQCQLLTKSKR
jgi:molybdopterin-containing oxidoreductase family iron-sulfur binding subunit